MDVGEGAHPARAPRRPPTRHTATAAAQLGPGLPAYSYNIVVERLVHCNNPSVLEALFLRLWDVAAQRDRANIYAQRGEVRPYRRPEQRMLCVVCVCIGVRQNSPESRVRTQARGVGRGSSTTSTRIGGAACAFGR